MLFIIIVNVILFQMLIWIAIPQLRGSKRISAKIILRLIIIFQFLLRLILTVPLTSQIVKATGVVMETAWAGAAYYLMLYMLASHVSVYFFIFLLSLYLCFCLYTEAFRIYASIQHR